MSTLGTSETKRSLLLRRHGIAVFFASASLLWGVGFAQLGDGRLPSFDRNVVAALASEADSSAAAERLRTSAMQGAPRHPGGERPGPPSTLS
ncbi:MAG: hypothetical protein QOF85_1386 [Solirubrobacterales bacterium]|nr:hypothetical protein [Solirubrobacterales bacterium]